MRTSPTRVRGWLGKSLIAAIILNAFGGFAPVAVRVQAQERRVIVINADQPNVWTLEQAHYLLAQMHRRNLDLRAKSLEELDPNEITGLRFDVLRTLIDLGVKFDDANRVTNSMLQRNREFNAGRREQLVARRQQLRDESLALTREISGLQTERAGAGTDEEKARLDAEIAAKTAARAEVDKEVEFTDKELGTLTAPSGEFQRTEAPPPADPANLPKSIFDDAFKDAAKTMIDKFNEAPRLNASLMLDNFLNMQYEIIAKQLTLLRDEVGPGERLLFLELPQTVNVAHHEANRKWAQSWWRIVGYTRNIQEYDDALPDRRMMRRETLDHQERMRSRSQNQSQSRSQAEEEDEERRRGGAERNLPPDPTAKKVEELLRGLRGVHRDARMSPMGRDNEYINLQSSEGTTVPVWDSRSDSTRRVRINDRTVRSIELIPRQSSLNVNDMKLRVHSGALSVVANFLFGFGARLNVQRQREQFSQFVQQELYSSAFGKGSREFGWTFTPMPGTDRLLPGVRTTYAVVVVPDEATTLVLEANGCYFPRSAYQPTDFDDTLQDRWREGRTSRNCGDSKGFLVPIPVGGSGRNDFFVKGLTYEPVDKGGRVVVSIYGYNFSSQTGVLVNGVPLTQSIGLAQPLIRDDSKSGAAAAEDLKGEKVRGRIERIDSEQIVFSFEMPSDFAGTPTITLVAPGKAIDLNRLRRLYINGTRNTSLADSSDMFRDDPDPPVPRIDGVEVHRSGNGRTLTVLASGAGFEIGHRVFFNGVEQSAHITPTLLRAEIPATQEETVQVTFSTGTKTIKSKPVPNPAHLKVSNVTVVSYEPPSRRSPVAVLIVRLEGSGFSDWLLPSAGDLTALSPSEALLRIEDPADITPLVLTDRRTGFEARTAITLSRPRK